MQQKPGITFSPVNQLSMAEGHSKVHESPRLQALPAMVMTSVFLPHSHRTATDQPTNSTLFACQICYTFLSDYISNHDRVQDSFKVVLISRITIVPESLREGPWGFEVQISEEKFPGNKTVF